MRGRWKEIVRQKDDIVDNLRNSKYLDVLDSYGESITLFRQRARHAASSWLPKDADTDKILGAHVVAPEGGEIFETFDKDPLKLSCCE